jgi:hypothetical protein
MIGFSLIVVQIVLGILYANMIEWLVHKYVFHGRKLGKKRSGRFSHHWHDHHRAVRKGAGLDPAYSKKWYYQVISREALELSVLSVLHSPLIFIVPYFSMTISIWIFLYYAVHSRQHINPEWAKKWTPWHWDHHMGKNQDANWCVTLPIMDHVLGTRVYYYGTPEYNKDKLKKAMRNSK